MSTTYTSTLFTSVTQTAPGEIIAQSFLSATTYEAVATIRAAAATFAIDEAHWTVSRSPGGAENGERYVSALRGLEACLGSGPALRAAAKAEGELPYRLFAECVKGIIQAETYLFRDRGFPDAATYDRHWKDNYAGLCRLYSNQHRITREWCDHVAERAWGRLLFTRAKSTTVLCGREGELAVNGAFTDSFHELAVAIEIAEGVITAATGQFLRAPDPVCLENTAHLLALPGTSLAADGNAKAARLVGGPQGCVHMADLVDHMIRAANEAKSLAK